MVVADLLAQSKQGRGVWRFYRALCALRVRKDAKSRRAAYAACCAVCRAKKDPRRAHAPRDNICTGCGTARRAFILRR